MVDAVETLSLVSVMVAVVGISFELLLLLGVLCRKVNGSSLTK